MAFSRYKNSTILDFGAQYGTSRLVVAIRAGVRNGTIPLIATTTTTGNQRLDHLAASYYKDSRYWWILAAASEIGWGLQIPPGTIVNVPSLDVIASFVG